MDTWSKVVIHVLAGTQTDSSGCHPTTQNGAQFETQEVFISVIPHLTFSGHRWRWETETAGSKPVDKGGLLYTSNS